MFLYEFHVFLEGLLSIVGLNDVVLANLVHLLQNIFQDVDVEEDVVHYHDLGARLVQRKRVVRVIWGRTVSTAVRIFSTAVAQSTRFLVEAYRGNYVTLTCRRNPLARADVDDALYSCHFLLFKVIDRCHIEYLLLSCLLILRHKYFLFGLNLVDLYLLQVALFINKSIFVDFFNGCSKECLRLLHRSLILDIRLVNLTGLIVVEHDIDHLV